MNTSAGNDCDTARPDPAPRERTGRILALVILAVGALAVAALVVTRPEVSQMPPPPMEARVEWIPAETAGSSVRIEAQGVVIPAREVAVMPRVTGEVIGVHPNFEPGGRIAAGDEMVRLDPKDYRFTLSDREAALARADADLRIERGQGEIASNEWARAAGPDAGPAPELALRIPQRDRAEAAVRSAATARDLAAENLERTVLRAPFNAVVLERNVTLGSQATPQSVLAKIASSDEYWADISVPVDRLAALPAADVHGALPALPVRVLYGGRARAPRGGHPCESPDRIIRTHRAAHRADPQPDRCAWRCPGIDAGQLRAVRHGRRASARDRRRAHPEGRPAGERYGVDLRRRLTAGDPAGDGALAGTRHRGHRRAGEGR